MMEIKFAGWDGKKVKVQTAGEYENFTIESEETPEPEFKDALQEFAHALLLHTEYGDQALERTVMTGVTWTRNKDGIVLVVLSGAVSLEQHEAALKLKTPHLGLSQLSSLVQAKLEAFRDLAERYVNGHRAQMSLPEE